jgi:hypothetical protein
MRSAADVDLTAIVFGLQAEVAKLKVRIRKLERKDQAEKVRALFSRLLPAIAGRHGSACWTVAEVLADKVLCKVAGNVSPSSLGSSLARYPEQDGLIVEKLGKDRANRTLWRIGRKLG